MGKTALVDPDEKDYNDLNYILSSKERLMEYISRHETAESKEVDRLRNFEQEKYKAFERYMVKND